MYFGILSYNIYLFGVHITLYEVYTNVGVQKRCQCERNLLSVSLHHCSGPMEATYLHQTGVENTLRCVGLSFQRNFTLFWCM